jgi:uncharacterized membrane protein YecN with MAPEG domain
MIENFITILAWSFGILSSFFTIARIIAKLTYDDLDEIRDRINGFKRTYPVIIPGSIALICWAWILS